MILNRVPSGKRDQSEAALRTIRPERYSPTALRRPPPPRSWTQYAVVRTFMRRNFFALLRFAVGGWVAQLARNAPMRHARTSRGDVACNRMRAEYPLKLKLASHNFRPCSHAVVFTVTGFNSRKRALGFTPGAFSQARKLVGRGRFALRLRTKPARGRASRTALGNGIDRDPIEPTAVRLLSRHLDSIGRSCS